MKKTIISLILLSLILVPTVSGADKFGLDISKGLVPGHELVVIQGLDEAIANVEHLIWGEAAYVFPPAATLMNVSSSSVNDDVGNTGAWNVTIQGLDANWQRINETVVMDGQLPVSTTLQYLRINRMFTERVGANERNVGNIYIGTGAVAVGVPAVIYNKIEPSHGISSTALYTVPVGKTAFIEYFHVGTDANKVIELALQIRCEDCPDNGWITSYHDHFESMHIIHSLPLPFPVMEKRDIAVFALTAVGGGFATVDAFIVLVDNDQMVVADDLAATNNTLLYMVIIVLALIALGSNMRKR